MFAHNGGNGCRLTRLHTGGLYHTFTAQLSYKLSVPGSGPESEEPHNATWYVYADGQILGKGEVTANSAPEPLAVGLSGAKNLELLLDTSLGRLNNHNNEIIRSEAQLH
jgi:hypothetical protein